MNSLGSIIDNQDVPEPELKSFTIEISVRCFAEQSISPLTLLEKSKELFGWFQLIGDFIVRGKA